MRRLSLLANAAESWQNLALSSKKVSKYFGVFGGDTMRPAGWPLLQRAIALLVTALPAAAYGASEGLLHERAAAHLSFSQAIDPGETVEFAGQATEGHASGQKWLVISRKPTQPTMMYEYAVYLLGYSTSTGLTRYEKRQLEGEGTGQVLFGHLAGGDTWRVFVFVDGQRTTAYMLQIGGRATSVEYEKTEGQSRIAAEDVDGDGIFEIVVRDQYLHKDIPDSEVLRWCPDINGHPFLIYTYKFDGTKYALYNISPNLDAEAQAANGGTVVAPDCSKRSGNDR